MCGSLRVVVQEAQAALQSRLTVTGGVFFVAAVVSVQYNPTCINSEKEGYVLFDLRKFGIGADE
jgi:hypothetical protein